MKQLLIVNACVNRETSRTNRLSKALIKLVQEKEAFASVTELVLEEENIQPLNSASLRRRSELAGQGDFCDRMFDYARQLLEVDCVIIAAPYWEFAFPAMLKNYLEAISVIGLTYNYNEWGVADSLCKIEKLYYVTTAGGYIGDLNFGYEQVKAVATLLLGIRECRCISADGLDIITNDVEAIVNKAIADLPELI